MAEQTLETQSPSGPGDADVDITISSSSSSIRLLSEVEANELAERIRSVEALLGSTAERLWSSLRLRAPASRSAVEALERSTVGVGRSAALTCVVCVEELSVGSEMTHMPCSHGFHSHCILKWLEKRHTCPVCRFELPFQSS